jgi:hypothetical protein
MTVKSLRGLAMMLPLLFVGCSGSEPAAPAAPAPAVPQAQMNMLQLMRAFPFPHSNVLFDTQSRDPEGPEKLQSMSYSVYRWVDADTYAGWAGVENSALALAEMAPLLLMPRECSNGKPAPVDQEDWKAAVAGLATVGRSAAEVVRAKNVDAMLDVGEQLVNACAACHDKYRDVDLEGGERCQVSQSQ